MHSSRGLLLYILPLALIPASILSFVYGDLLRIIVNLSGCISYLLAASLLRKGISAELEYRDRKITLAPKWPQKPGCFNCGTDNGRDCFYQCG